MAQAKGTDLGAALRGLIMSGAVIFLLMLTIVWLTNRHFEGKKAAGGHGPPAPAAAPAATAPAAPAQGAAAQPGTPPAGAPATTGAHPIPVSPQAAAGKPGPAPPPPPPPTP